MIIILLIAILLLTNCPLQTIGYVEEVVDVRSVVMIIAQDNFRDEELLQPKQVLEKAGIVVKVASRKKAKAKGMLGASVMPDMVLEEINVQDFDAVIFVGGSGASTYWDDLIAHKIAKDAYSANKVGKQQFGLLKQES